MVGRSKRLRVDWIAYWMGYILPWTDGWTLERSGYASIGSVLGYLILTYSHCALVRLAKWLHVDWIGYCILDTYYHCAMVGLSKWLQVDFNMLLDTYLLQYSDDQCGYQPVGWVGYWFPDTYWIYWHGAMGRFSKWLATWRLNMLSLIHI